MIASKCCSITDIEDLYQETYLRVYEAMEAGGEIENAEAFVIGTAKHCISHYYTAVQRLRARISLSRGGADDKPIDLEDDTDIEQVVADRALYEQVFDEVTRLPAELQRVFYLHYFLELPISETASASGHTENEVKQLLYKASRRIRRRIGRDRQ